MLCYSALPCTHLADTLDQGDPAAMQELLERTVQGRDGIMAMLRRQMQPPSAAYSRMIRDEGLTYEELVQK
jgi:hypothetical protein